MTVKFEELSESYRQEALDMAIEMVRWILSENEKYIDEKEVEQMGIELAHQREYVIEYDDVYKMNRLYVDY